MLDHAISAFDDLREHIGEPRQAVLDKQLDHLDRHCRRFIELSPIALLATADADGRCDCSPRGGPPGFARVLDERRLAIPDYTGNRRQDSHANVLANPHVGLLFLLPGMGETLRVNGRAALSTDPALLEDLPHRRHQATAARAPRRRRGGLPALPEGVPARRRLGPRHVDAAGRAAVGGRDLPRPPRHTRPDRGADARGARREHPRADVVSAGR
jgi:predicted pyridoxine 5'-phosphate oxidase superfamily flavin-nucleotide-binding protein